MSKISVERWIELFEGFDIVGCALRQEDILYILAEEKQEHRVGRGANDPNEHITALIIYVGFEKSEERRWSVSELISFSHAKATVAQHPKVQCVGVHSTFVAPGKSIL